VGTLSKNIYHNQIICLFGHHERVVDFRHGAQLGARLAKGLITDEGKRNQQLINGW
jgi:hypothetical protein